MIDFERLDRIDQEKDAKQIDYYDVCWLCNMLREAWTKQAEMEKAMGGLAALLKPFLKHEHAEVVFGDATNE
jgi:hypothetical protein